VGHGHVGKAKGMDGGLYRGKGKWLGSVGSGQKAKQ
jgi:hypothetical protein